MNSTLKSTLKIIDQVTAIASESYASLLKEGLLAFLKEFYRFSLPEDLDKYTAEELAASGANMFKFMKERAKGTHKVRIYNPETTKHGWESRYTIIELVNEDIPFLVDSLSEELARHSIKIHNLFHPVVEAERTEKGHLKEVRPTNGEQPNPQAESVIQIHISHISSNQAKALEQSLETVLEAVKVSVADWSAILNKVDYVVTELTASAGLIAHHCSSSQKKALFENTTEIREFLEWLKNGNFVFLGYVEYQKSSGKTPAIVKGSSLGILKLGDPEVLPKNWRDLKENPLLGSKQKLLEITKANRRSLVHRPVHMDYIGVKHVDEHGQVIGEHRFLGLFTSSVYFQSARNIPIIRKKIEAIHKKSGFTRTGHSGKALAAILEDFPRDELLQSTEEELFDAGMGIILLNIQPKVRLFIRKDEFERFISCIIFIPRDNMSTSLRQKMERVLTRAFNGTVANHYTQIAESHMARLQIIIKTEAGKIPHYRETDLEEELAACARRWSDDLQFELFRRFDDTKAEGLFERYRNAFSISYQNRFSLEDAYYDILQIEKVLVDKQVAFDIYESLEGTDEIFEFKVYTPEKQITLSRIMPIMENMGLSTMDEHTYQVKPTETDVSIWVHRFRFVIPGMKKPKLKTIKKNFETAIFKTWNGQVQNDSLNKLILLANLPWRDISLIRAYTKYLQQSCFSYSEAFVQESLCHHPELVVLLTELFYCRFDPAFTESRNDSAKSCQTKVENILSKVSNLAEDRVIRALMELILATKRTNYFQTTADGSVKDYISFKFASTEISWLPKPKPFAEIFVYSSRVEGIHLRGGKVARGGLRWSDRREDFRTEVLGLMKAQMTKNSVIIPVGSKGGFVVKQVPATGGREALMQEGIECYKTFLRGLLDVTDNILQGEIVPPAQVVRHDEDDAYLVVAADKGTATFSDYANAVSAEYNFWLDDAFASGGSVGYDHKKMGITARGAWISVQRHFNEMGVDVSREDFTVIGIGDMAGDVFGNGMLCSKHIRLIGAFNHLHIFLDPDPNPAESFKERKRLFNLPRSSWADYNPEHISKGGGVFERSAKSIKLSPQIKKALGIEAAAMTPDELIRTMLKAPVDLIWNGGIGTYVKSSSQGNDEVGDKANDILRVNGGDVCARVIGEGGNLGFTQLGRIEYAKKGGRINTDAIDNSAGVDCSDHEVNIKITLREPVQKGTLTLEKRNILLESMTDEVAELVLRDNRLQTQALTLAELQGNSILEGHTRLIHALEKDNRLDRKIEFLPSDDELARRMADGKGLTRPELSVLLAYSKIVLFEELVNSNLPDDPYYKDDLIRYFPQALQTRFEKEILQHPLRREIIATSVTNSILNRIGSALFYHLQEDTGTASCDIARAYTITRDVFGLRAVWDEIDGFKSVPVEAQKELFLEVQNLVERATLWFLRHCPQPLDVSKTVETFASGVEDLYKCLHRILPAPLEERFGQRLKRFESMGVPKELAEYVSSLETMASACDVVEVAQQSGLTVAVAGTLYFDIGARLNMTWLRQCLRHLTTHSYWDKLSHKTLIDELYDQQRRLTLTALQYLGEKQNKAAPAVKLWETKHAKQIARYDAFLMDLKAHDEPEESMIILAIRKIKEIASV